MTTTVVGVCVSFPLQCAIWTIWWEWAAIWASDWGLECVCTSWLLAGAAADCSLLNISDVIIHDRNLKMNMSEINPAMSFLSFSFAIWYRLSKWLTAQRKDLVSFFKKKAVGNKSFSAYIKTYRITYLQDLLEILTFLEKEIIATSCHKDFLCHFLSWYLLI